MLKFRTIAAAVVFGASMSVLPGCLGSGVLTMFNSASTVLSILATVLGFVLPAAA